MSERRRPWGTVIEMAGSFAVRWWEGRRRHQRGGFATREAAINWLDIKRAIARGGKYAAPADVGPRPGVPSQYGRGISVFASAWRVRWLEDGRRRSKMFQSEPAAHEFARAMAQARPDSELERIQNAIAVLDGEIAKRSMRGKRDNCSVSPNPQQETIQ